MERLQGPLNHSCFVGEHLEQYHGVDLGEEKGLSLLEEELEAEMPFLQMLQSVETQQQQSLFPLKEPNFQTLLKLQHLKKSPWELGTTTNNNNYHHYYMNNDMSDEFMETQIQGLDFESCVTTTTTTHDTVVDYSTTSLHESTTVKSESKDHYTQQVQAPQVELRSQETQKGKSSSQVSREKRKRKRTRPSKNKEEVETQRMTHIAVERNRRRQMNEHLSVLRSLMPNSYIHRGDQASIVGGAIDFVKELEQLLQSLEAQKRIMRISTEENNNYSISSSSNSSSSSSSSTSSSSNGLSQFRLCRVVDREESRNNTVGDEVRAENKSESSDIEVTVIQTHVNLKVQCPKRPGQLLKAIVALEDLSLTILHLNITSSHDKILYSLNLKIEDGCKLGSADEIAGAVHQIFRIIDRS